MTSEKPDLDAAYALRTSADSERLYRDWAVRYDADFARARGYVYPREVARVLLAETLPGPVLDIGAGTGLVAEHLSGEVDGIDISPEMLEVAAAKGLYRRRIVADLTKPLPLGNAEYGGLVSAGTFTHGHVGPVCLPELLRVARPGARFALGVNAQVFDGAGFGSAFARLVAARLVTPLDFVEVLIYEGATHEHADDRALVAVFRRL